MDWKLFLTTFGAIFLAEMGDKTQIATLTFAAGGSSRWIVFAGSALALVATSAVAVLAGEVISRHVSPALAPPRGGCGLHRAGRDLPLEGPRPHTVDPRPRSAPFATRRGARGRTLRRRRASRVSGTARPVARARRPSCGRETSS